MNDILFNVGYFFCIIISFIILSLSLQWMLYSIFTLSTNICLVLILVFWSFVRWWLNTAWIALSFNMWQINPWESVVNAIIYWAHVEVIRALAFQLLDDNGLRRQSQPVSTLGSAWKLHHRLTQALLVKIGSMELLRSCQWLYYKQQTTTPFWLGLIVPILFNN